MLHGVPVRPLLPEEDQLHPVSHRRSNAAGAIGVLVGGSAAIAILTVLTGAIPWLLVVTVAVIVLVAIARAALS